MKTSAFREKGSHNKGMGEAHDWKLKSQAVSFTSVSRVRPSLEVVAKHFAWRIFKCDFLTFHPYYIYPNYSQIVRRPFKEKNPR